MPKVWRFAPYDETSVRALSAQLGVSPILAQVLYARGYSDGDLAQAFLNSKLTELHDPELLPGVANAADRMVAALTAGRRITIYGDYDVDGVTATSLLWHCLKLAGARVEYYVPHRLEEGYGLNCDALQKLHETDPAMLVVTVDCGISSVKEAALARSLGLELIITDHHQPGDELPDAAVIVHPRLPGEGGSAAYPFGDLCGVGVAFKLAWAICQRLGDGKRASPRMRDFLMAAVGLAAIGTIADVVPLVGENRVLVRYGLQSLKERASLGIRALMQAAGLQEKQTLQAEDIAFGIGPRINAAGRLGQARLAVELLTTDNPERALKLAEYLEEQNKVRQTVERRILKQARELVESHPEWQDGKALVLAQTDWHPGVIGIVASRVAELYQKPVVLIALNAQEQTGQGSARSFAGFDLYGGLSACASHLQTYGGHQAAAGLRIRSECVDAFREEFCGHVADTHEVAQHHRELHVDAEVRLADLSVRAVQEMERMGPFGRLNARPVLACQRVELVEPPKKMGGGERHLSLRVRHYGKTLRAVSFGNGDWADEIAACTGGIGISFAPQINAYQGRESVELRLLDWKPVTSPSNAPVPLPVA